MNKRGARTRQRLIDAAAELMAAEPAATIGLERIARSAGVAKSSVLWHFGSKEQLYLEVVDRWFATLREDMVGELGGGRDLREVLPRFVESYAAFLQARPEANTVLFAVLFGSARDGALRPRIAEMYCEFRQAFVDHVRLDGRPMSEGDAAVVVAALDGLFVQMFIDPPGFAHGPAFESLVRLARGWPATTEGVS